MTGSAVKFTPPPSPPSPAASFYDVSDEEEAEYNTIAHTSSGRGVKLLYSKSKVCLLSDLDPMVQLLLCFFSTMADFESRAVPRTSLSTGLCPPYAVRQR